MKTRGVNHSKKLAYDIERLKDFSEIYGTERFFWDFFGISGSFLGFIRFFWDFWDFFGIYEIFLGFGIFWDL